MKLNKLNLHWLICCIGILNAATALAAPSDYFAIHIVDDKTGRGVPLVRLQTANKVRYITDSNGYVAYFEPGMMDQDIYFEITSWGYEAPDIGMGYHGAILRTVPGRESEVKIHRNNIAERLYRLTGEGIYRDTVLLGKQAPIAQPVVNGKVMGSDTVETAVYRGKMYWFWGDTDSPSHPLGNFSTTGATSLIPEKLNLEKGIDYTYFVHPKTGFARAMISLPTKETFPIWVDGMMVVSDPSGQSHLLCHYSRNKNMVPVEQGIAQWNDSKEVFESLHTYPVDTAPGPGSRPMRAISGGREYYYFPNPFQTARVLADYAHATDISAYEGFTCLKPGTAFSKDHPEINRDEKGKLVWTWQPGARPIGPRQFKSIVQAGAAAEDESPWLIKDDHGKAINVVQGTTAWNPYLKKWTLLFGQSDGDSYLGEIWLAIGNSPQGPWVTARKVATHAMKKDNNDFYNPLQHPEFMQQNGRIIYFEGTFVTTFSGNPAPTPRYDYNQILYRIDLSDPRIVLPEPPPGLTEVQPAIAQQEHQ